MIAGQLNKLLGFVRYKSKMIISLLKINYLQTSKIRAKRNRKKGFKSLQQFNGFPGQKQGNRKLLFPVGCGMYCRQWISRPKTREIFVDCFCLYIRFLGPFYIGAARSPELFGPYFDRKKDDNHQANSI